MVYTPNEARMLDNIRAAFDSYIRESSFFDLIYSEKFGYIWIHVEEHDEGMLLIHTVDKMLNVLFDEVVDSVRTSRGEGHFTDNLTQSELDEIRRRLTETLQSTGPDADFCLDCMERYLRTL